jgi:colicin import membrane protein
VGISKAAAEAKAKAEEEAKAAAEKAAAEKADAAEKASAALEAQERAHIETKRMLSEAEKNRQTLAKSAEKAAAEAKAAADNAPVQLIMTLGLDFSIAGSEGSDKREKFTRDVAQDLASASGLPPANFRIKDVSPGSIILDMQVMPDPSAPGAHLLAAKDLAEQAADPSSTLRSGKITSHATGVEVIPPTPRAIEVEVMTPISRNHSVG